MPVSARKVPLDRPVLMAGFPDSGMIGSVSINHIIEQLKMHQIAFIESQHVMPAAIFIGKRFRHPFRIYANDSGAVCALICEVPVIARGTSSIINTIIDWSANAGVREIIVLGGILPTNFSPPYIVERKPLLLQNMMEENKHSGQDSAEMVVPDDAVIVGLSGSLLSLCAARSLKCSALMSPTMSEAPDPEGAAIVLDGSGSTPGDGATIVSYEWDFTNNGQFTDASGVDPLFSLVGQDGVFPVHLRVTNSLGLVDESSTTVTVNNVLPGFTRTDRVEQLNAARANLGLARSEQLPQFEAGADLKLAVTPSLTLDVTGHYSRPDIFEFGRKR